MKPPSDAPAPAVYIVEPDAECRAGLVTLCESVSLATRAFARPGALLEQLEPDSRGCVVMNVWLPEMTGLQLQRAILQKQARLPLIMLTSQPDLATAVDALKRGAFDFMEKGCSQQALLERIFRAIEQDARQAAQQHRTETIRGRLAQLTTRERQILDLLIEGKTTKQAAGLLGLSAKTVENHRARLMDKMDAENIAGLLRSVYFATAGPDALNLADHRRSSRTSGAPTPLSVAV